MNQYLFILPPFIPPLFQSAQNNIKSHYLIFKFRHMIKKDTSRPFTVQSHLRSHHVFPSSLGLSLHSQIVQPISVSLGEVTTTNGTRTSSLSATVKLAAGTVVQTDRGTSSVNVRDVVGIETFSTFQCFFPPQLSPSEPEQRPVSGAAAVGGAGRLPGAGDGRGVPPLHPQPLPSQHHLGGEPLAAAGPAGHCEHPDMDLPEGGRGTQELQELKVHCGLQASRPTGTLHTWTARRTPASRVEP